MVGAFYTDDFYFCFEKGDIESLKNTHRAEGAFSFKEGNAVCTIRLIVSIEKQSESHIGYSFDFFEQLNPREVHLYLVDTDQQIDWFFDEKASHPGWRFASCNVYFFIEGRDQGYSLQKQLIENFSVS